MRAQWIFLLCVECAAYLASASISRHGLRHRRGTVAERRVPYRTTAVKEQKPLIPDIGTAPGQTPAPLDELNSPESLANMANYRVAMPTPEPAALDGAYCRGGACQYRVNAPPPTLPPMVTPPPIPLGGSELASHEFCRGLSCITGMGMPVDHGLAPFTLNCVHLFNDVGGGMTGDDLSRNVAQVHDSFEKVCRRRVDILEAGSCANYASTFVGALAVKVNNPTVGGTVEVCQDAFFWTKAFKQAEIDLKLSAVALPKRKSLLAANLNRFGTGGVGPSSPRGMKWREYAWTHGKRPPPPAVPQQLAADGSIEGALLQTSKVADSPQVLDRESGLPRYQQNTNEAKHPVPTSKTKYQIAPGSPDGAVPPVEVAGDLFDYCSQQFSEIMAGFTQTARATVQMTQAWCGWQSSVSSWVGQQQEFGHPDWSPRTCSGMENLVAFAVRDDLANAQGGLSAQQVCKKVFLAIGSVHRAEGLVKGAWESATRGPPISGLPPASDADMQDMLRDAQEYANKVFSKLRQQKVNYEKLNNVKSGMAAVPDTLPQLDAPKATPPDLPSVNDFDPTALLALSIARVRQSTRVGILVVDQLTPWGFAA